jgi:hypothetical protein
MKYTPKAGQPVQNFAFGGIANPTYRPTLRTTDRSYLDQRQQELDAFEKQRQEYNTALDTWNSTVYRPYVDKVNEYNAAAQQYNTQNYSPYQAQVDEYNRALEAYNRDVYDPYAKQYGEYETAINAWNAGPRTTDYAGPAAPTLARTFDMTAPVMPEAFGMQAPVAPDGFTMAAPTLAFNEADVVARQKASAATAERDAAARNTAVDVMANPDKYNFGSKSVSARFMAEGGPVTAPPPGMTQAQFDAMRQALMQMDRTVDPFRIRVPAEFSQPGAPSPAEIARATALANAAQNGMTAPPPPPAPAPAAVDPVTGMTMAQQVAMRQAQQQQSTNVTPTPPPPPTPIPVPPSPLDINTGLSALRTVDPAAMQSAANRLDELVAATKANAVAADTQTTRWVEPAPPPPLPAPAPAPTAADMLRLVQPAAAPAPAPVAAPTPAPAPISAPAPVAAIPTAAEQLASMPAPVAGAAPLIQRNSGLPPTPAPVPMPAPARAADLGPISISQPTEAFNFAPPPVAAPAAPQAPEPVSIFSPTPAPTPAPVPAPAPMPTFSAPTPTPVSQDVGRVQPAEVPPAFTSFGPTPGMSAAELLAQMPAGAPTPTPAPTPMPVTAPAPAMTKPPEQPMEEIPPDFSLVPSVSPVSTRPREGDTARRDLAELVQQMPSSAPAMTKPPEQPMQEIPPDFSLVPSVSPVSSRPQENNTARQDLATLLDQIKRADTSPVASLAPSTGLTEREYQERMRASINPEAPLYAWSPKTYVRETAEGLVEEQATGRGQVGVGVRDESAMEALRQYIFNAPNDEVNYLRNQAAQYAPRIASVQSRIEARASAIPYLAGPQQLRVQQELASLSSHLGDLQRLQQSTQARYEARAAEDLAERQRRYDYNVESNNQSRAVLERMQAQAAARQAALDASRQQQLERTQQTAQNTEANRVNILNTIQAAQRAAGPSYAVPVAGTPASQVTAAAPTTRTQVEAAAPLPTVNLNPTAPTVFSRPGSTATSPVSSSVVGGTTLPSRAFTPTTSGQPFFTGSDIRIVNPSIPMVTAYNPAATERRQREAEDVGNYFAMAPRPQTGSLPGTVGLGYNPLAAFQGPTASTLLGLNPNLSPVMLGGLGNAGMMVDRLGNRIYAPGTPGVRAFSEGGEVDDEEDSSESAGMLRELESTSPMPDRISKKRTMTGQSGGAQMSKGMGMSKEMDGNLGDMGASKGFEPKSPKSARAELELLARQYKIKQRRAADAAKGLGKNTFGKPSLEKPSLTTGEFDVKRFQKGGEAKKVEGEPLQSPEEQPVVEESSASRALKQLVAPVREGVKGYFGMEPETAGSDAYRTGQALSNMPGVGGPAALGIFIGRGAKGWNKAMNDVARRMSKQGATPEEVWQTTGNFKGPDGMWRQEISDQAARHRSQVSQGPAGMLFEHPELYANYPDLKDILVRTDPYATKSSLVGGGQPGAVINLGTAGGKAENVRGMLHELQHDIQFREGFGQGGSQLMAFNDPRALKILEEVRAKIAQPASLEEFARDAWRTDKITPEIEKGYKTYLAYRKNNARDIDIEAQKTAARIYYERLLGEAESRAVESRWLSTPEQRRLVLPSQSYRRDGGSEVIPLKDLIIKKAEGGEVKEEDLSGPITTPMQFNRKQKQGRISKALNDPSGRAYANMARGASELPYDIAGAPVDIATMLMRPAGYSVEKPVMGSDWIKEKMTGTGVRPEPPSDSVDKGFYTAGELLSNLTNPAGVVRSGVKGATTAANMLEDVTVGNVQRAKVRQAAKKAEATPDTAYDPLRQRMEEQGQLSYAVRPTGSTMLSGVQDSQNFGRGFVDEILDKGRRQAKQNAPDQDTAQILEQFWDKKAKNYFNRQFGTPNDPIAEAIAKKRIKGPLLDEDFPEYMLDQLAVGKTRKDAQGQEQFFPKYPRAVEDFTKRYDLGTGMVGSVLSLDPQVVHKDYGNILSAFGKGKSRDIAETEGDKLILQGLRPELVNPRAGIVFPERSGSSVAGEGTSAAKEMYSKYLNAAPLPENIRTAIAKGEPVYDVEEWTMSPAMQRMFDPSLINQYLLSIPKREVANIRFEDAVRGAVSLDESVSKFKNLDKRIREGKRVPDKVFAEGVSEPLLQFDKGPFEGYAWKRILNKESTVPEGAYVGHSVGGYQMGGPTYTRAKMEGFDKGDWQIYTLRDNRNKPVTTIEVAMEGRDPIVKQIKGNGRATGNTAPVNYDQLVFDFLTKNLHPARIDEIDKYLTPLLQTYRDELNRFYDPAVTGLQGRINR